MSILLPGAVQNAAAQGTISPSKSSEKNQEPSEKPIDITADKVEHQAEKHRIYAYGHVVVYQEERIINADEVAIDTESGHGVARGHVHITDPETNLYADRISFNFKDKKGKLYNAKGRVVKQYLIRGKEMTRLSESHYKTKQATLTTCTGKIPDWEILTKEADLKMLDRAMFTDATVKVRGTPVAYIPWGYVPLDNTRKSGFLPMTAGNSNINGFTMNPSYYWAIDEQSDATVMLEYMEKRGVRPNVEYRYTPSKYTRGDFHANYLDDAATGNKFYKVDWHHNQVIPEQNMRIDGQLDIIGNTNADKTFNDNTLYRTRRSTDNFLNVNKTLGPNQMLDFTTRMRTSAEDERDDMFGILPSLTHRYMRTQIGTSPFYFNQDTSFTGFLIDRDPTIASDKTFSTQRFDYHPQITGVFNPTSWLTFSQVIGARETLYSKGLDASTEREYGMFSRELLDFQSNLEGPKFNRIFDLDNSRIPKLNHIIEPRLTYDYIPDMDKKDRSKIHAFDTVDQVTATNRLTYSLIQRLLAKEMLRDDDSIVKEILRFEIRQTVDVGSQTSNLLPGDTLQPFSDLRFDVKSRIIDPLMINFDTTYNPRDRQWTSANFQIGTRPWKNVSFYFDRRYTLDQTTFYSGTADIQLNNGWRFTYTARYDGLTKEFQEQDVSLKFDDKCFCWGISADLIQRNNINGGLNQAETKFMVSLILRGLGTFGSNNRQPLTHRYFY